jgi:hypothetical protein
MTEFKNGYDKGSQIELKEHDETAEAKRVKQVNDDGSTYQAPALVITNAINQTNYDLNASAFSATTNINNDYFFDSIELNFSTNEAKTITITSSDGTILWGGDVNTSSSNKGYNTTAKNFNLIFQQGFNANENITVTVTQLASAGIMDCILKATEGQSTLNGTPSLGAGDEVIGKVKIVDPITGKEVNVEKNGGLAINVQDQHTPIIIAYMNNEEASSTLATNPTVINDLSFDVVDATGFTIGGYLSIFSVPDNRFYLASILNIVSNTITVDTPLDFAYPVGSFVTSGNRNMNVDGSTTPVIYGLRNTEEAIGSAFDITRIMFVCLTESSIDLSKFGDIADGLTNGIVLRKKDGEIRNIFNVKTNGELKNMMYDFDISASTNPQQGQDGFVGRLTFSGQSKMGVTLRLEPGEDMQIIIQDDLTSLTRFAIIAEGHTVTD